jgi:hypothetical protein
VFFQFLLGALTPRAHPGDRSALFQEYALLRVWLLAEDLQQVVLHIVFALLGVVAQQVIYAYVEIGGDAFEHIEIRLCQVLNIIAQRGSSNEQIFRKLLFRQRQ